MTVFERIESLRKSKKISQGKLEKELGFSNGSISKWKTSMPTLERLQKIADYFGVTINYLMTGEEDNVSLYRNGDITDQIDKIMLELESEDGPLYYNGKPIDDRKMAILRNALEIAFEKMESDKK
ncbi:helix-turn-helix domain-containing protein [Lacrimispora sp.]|uniref:helix-turn-helix domain-containing protein n=1 Tax=Lacrimispora sp. TaxID=2719234 RepID=UPI0028AA61DB|nr:helix-turn-helix transcriptional regulator [Lacrimispora sp.]